MLNAELNAIRKGMCRQLLRGRIVANELWAQVDGADLAMDQ